MTFWRPPAFDDTARPIHLRDEPMRVGRAPPTGRFVLLPWRVNLLEYNFASLHRRVYMERQHTPMSIPRERLAYHACPADPAAPSSGCSAPCPRAAAPAARTRERSRRSKPSGGFVRAHLHRDGALGTAAHALPDRPRHSDLAHRSPDRATRAAPDGLARTAARGQSGAAPLFL